MFRPDKNLEIKKDLKMKSIFKSTTTKLSKVSKVLAVATLAAGISMANAADTIKVGVLHSLSGTMAISETTLKDTVLNELVEGDREFEIAKQRATNSRVLLDFKRSGVYKGRVVIQGFLENKFFFSKLIA